MFFQKPANYYVAQREGLFSHNNSLGGLSHDPVPYDLNRRQAALQRLRYGWFHAGLSDKVREMLPFYRFRINLLWLKSPSPVSL